MGNTSRPLYNTTIKLSQNHSYIATCYHEAGHAVCGLLMFMKISDVSVLKKRRISGLTNYEQISEDQFDNSELKRFISLSDININYAGLAAEKIFYKDVTGSYVFPRVLKQGIEEDIENVATIIKENNFAPPGKKRYLYKKRMLKEVQVLLTQHWDVVKIVAHALFEKKKLNYDELKAVISRKTQDKKFWKKRFQYIYQFVEQNKKLDAKDIKIILGQ